MAIEIRDSIYTDIAGQFPAVYQDNSDFLVGFIEAYYEHLDSKLDRDLPKIRDIDSTLSAFLIHYRNKHMAGLPLSTQPAMDIRFVLKHITNLYTRKGTKESLELLFKTFFDEDIEIFYPGGHILKSSDSVWGGESFIEMVSVYDVLEYPIQRGNTIIGDLSKAQAFVDGIVFVNFGGSLTPIMYLSQQRGTFTAEDSLEVRGADENGNEFIKNVGKVIAGSLTSVTINERSRIPGQAVGDPVQIKSRENGVGAKGVVTKVSTEQIGTIGYTIEDGGFGYIDPSSIKIGGAQEQFADEQTVKISNQVVILEGTEVQDIKPGDSFVFPGSTLDYTGIEEDNGDSRKKVRYGLTGAGIVTSYQHPLVFLNTEKNKSELFEFLSDTYVQGTSYRNKLYDSFYNAYKTERKGSATNPIYDVDDVELMKVITESSENGGILGNFTGQNVLTSNVTSGTGTNHHVLTLADDNLVEYFQIGETVVSSGAFSGRANIVAIDIPNKRLTVKVFETGETLTSEADNDTVVVTGVNNGVYSVPENGANAFSLGEILVGGTTGNRAKITALDTVNNTITAEFAQAGSAVSGTLDSDYLGDLSQKSMRVQTADIKILKSYMLGLNNGFYDGAGDNDDWIGVTNNPVETGGAQGSGSEETDLIDRTPTISPFIPATQNTGLPNLTLSQLKSGQHYTVIYPGTTLGTDDWVKIGARAGYAGEDFLFNSQLLDQINDNTASIENHDAIFTPAKQVYALLLHYLVQQDILPKLTVGTAFETASTPGAYDSYFTNVQDLVPGRLYGIVDFGNTTYTDWINLGFDISSFNDSGLGIHSISSEYAELKPGRSYMIHTLGNTDWSLLGGSLESQVGDIITMPATIPSDPGTNGSVFDIAAVHTYHVTTFTATALPDGYSLVGKNGVCIDYNNVTGTLTDTNNNDASVSTSVWTTGGVFVNPTLDQGNEVRTPPEDVLANGVFNAFVNGSHTNVVKCTSISSLNESSSFELDSIDEAEIVTLSRDKIGDYYREILDPQSAGIFDANNPYADGNYEMLGVADVENINTLLGNAFGSVTFRIGSLKTLIENNPGTNYQNDVGVRVVNKLIESLDKKDIILNFDNSGFKLEKDEIITQEITLPTEQIDEVNNISAASLATIGTSIDSLGVDTPYGNSVTTFSIAPREYTVKAKFLKQDGKDFYFRPMSFYTFDDNETITIRSIDRTITSLIQDQESQPMGANAIIRGNASYASGQIEEVAITHTGYKYVTGATVDIVNKNPESPNFDQEVATASIESFGQGNTLGRWKTKSSFLNDSSAIIHDNDYYQEYSYDIKATTGPEIYKSFVDDVVGISGTKLFSTPLINSVNTVETNLSSEIVFFDVDRIDLATEGGSGTYSETYSAMPGTVQSINSVGVLSGSGFGSLTIGTLIRVSGNNTGVGNLPLEEFATDDSLAPLPKIYKLSQVSPTSLTLVTESDETVFTASGTLAGLTFEVVTRTEVPASGDNLVTEADEQLQATQVSREGSVAE